MDNTWQKLKLPKQKKKYVKYSGKSIFTIFYKQRDGEMYTFMWQTQKYIYKIFYHSSAAKFRKISQ